MSALSITSNAADLSAKLAAMISQQLPYVTARTLTSLAFDVRDAERDGLNRYFKIRRSWTKNSIKVIRAEKSDYPNCASIVGIRDKVLAGNITGGPREGSSAIPGKLARQLLNPADQTLGPRLFPGRLIKQGDTTDKGKRSKATKRMKSITKYNNAPFIFTSQRGPSAGEKVIAVRRSAKRLPIDILYVLTDRQPELDKRWPFVENAKQIVNKNYQRQFDKNLTAALR